MKRPVLTLVRRQCEHCRIPFAPKRRWHTLCAQCYHWTRHAQATAAAYRHLKAASA